MGRGFLPEECGAPGGSPVVVLSRALWQRRFAGDPHILGKTVVLNRDTFTVVGVGPEGFSGAQRDCRGRLDADIDAGTVDSGPYVSHGR